MKTFDLLLKLPPFLEIRLRGTNKKWNCYPMLTIHGSKVWLSYGCPSVSYPLYERIESHAELKAVIQMVSDLLEGKEFFEVSYVFIDGEKMDSTLYKKIDP